MNNSKILSRMIEQFRARHGRNPEQIVVSPQALALLALRNSVGSTWEGLPVICSANFPTGQKATVLAVAVDGNQVVALDG